MGIVFGAFCSHPVTATKKMTAVHEKKNYIKLEYHNGLLHFGKQKFMRVHGHSYEKDLYQDRQVVVASCSMLDNRIELADALGINRADITKTPDSTLIGKAYIKWGKAAPRHLEGTFAFAAYDKVDNTLMLARDQTGNASMYYCSDDSGVYFASTLRQLNNVHPKFRIFDTEILLRCLTIRPLFPISEFDRHSTIFRDVHTLPHGHIAIIVVDSDGSNNLRIEKYYDLHDNITPLRLKSNKEYEEAFIANISSVVRSAMHGYENFATQMSSGFDSATASCILANELRGTSRIQAYCYSPPNPGSLVAPNGNHLVDEYPLAQEIALHNGNIELVRVDQGPGNIWSNLDKSLNDYGGFFFHHANYGWGSNILSQCRLSGIDVLATATMGNLTLSSGRFGQAIAELKNAGRFGKLFSSVISILLHNATDIHCCRDILATTIRSICCNSNRRQTLNQNSIYRGSDFRADHANNIYKLLNSGITAFLTGLYSSLLCNPAKLDISLWAAYGIVLRDVLRHRKAFEFILSIPPEQHTVKFLDRSLIRRSATGLLPPKKLLSRTRGLQGSDWTIRLGSNWQDFLSYAESILDESLVRSIANTDSIKNFIWRKKTLDKYDYNSPQVNDIVRLVKLHRYLKLIESSH